MSGRHTPGDNEATSEFSYTDSDVLNRPKDDETDSFYSSQYSTIPPPRKVKTPGDLTEGRDSYLSSMSEYSAHDLSQVARSVSVKVVNRPIEPTVNRSASIKKLETQQETTGRLSPDMSYDTTIEGSIPPRSTRRPKSQVVDESSLQAEIANYKTNFPARVHGSGRGHKTSLSISDELDKLMERANSIKSKSYTFENLEPGDDSSVESKYSKLEPPLAGYSKSANKRSSSESFKTASLNSGSEHSGPSETALRLPKRTEVPPRPSTENLARARQVSSKVEQAAVEKRLSQMSGSSRERIHQTLPQPPALDDQFYDVDEPVVVEKPARGKSVKESTKHPRKPTRNTSKGRKSRGKRTSSSHEASGLKPFSYHTLINLLESINGTIIGEEFNQLNLPVKEKQLIEKIVDQLSRLTSDMVLDEHRYAVGIDRLERALRVLEGFM
ncbi:hypothetical protein CANTEDRAFT_123775 [Yamadazyma tenuis ATCC 10573]|uniref:Uncharacterized protein n=1 Tax=Candida tenuis (strain ATCC 10573 / BCRC 21748 / CBS 615 / JCM 9827 / NBRC 10315 / NRRL Y-1498 / VKM Y-70) TaxID=590646 RepID=G3B6G9_CANTC|nr:uncharacterized protein CANTEDRAFT_123775 [Yamadazyma tenuis ATCC 10573]EGV63463.1 hypothetical protein CANTEDRAFT_123775 [Yamadazyma tenuis ATCC 10573]